MVKTIISHLFNKFLQCPNHYYLVLSFEGALGIYLNFKDKFYTRIFPCKPFYISDIKTHYGLPALKKYQTDDINIGDSKEFCSMFKYLLTRDKLVKKRKLNQISLFVLNHHKYLLSQESNPSV